MKSYYNKYKKFCNYGIISSFIFFFGSMASAYEVDDNLVREYVNEVYNTASAINYSPPAADTFDRIIDTAVDDFEYNVIDEPYGGSYTNSDLTHFINEGRQYRGHESSFDCRDYNCYRQKYRQRHSHIAGCNICNGLSRAWIQNTNLEPVPFYPKSAYYNGRQLRTFPNGVIFRNQRCPTEFDLNARQWLFRYGGAPYRLSF